MPSYGGGGGSEADGMVTAVVARPKNTSGEPGAGARPSTVSQRQSITSAPTSVSLVPQPQPVHSATKVNLAAGGGGRAPPHASPAHVEQPADEFGEDEPLAAIGSAKMLYEYKCAAQLALVALYTTRACTRACTC